MRVKAYVALASPLCKKAMEFLKENNINFEIIDIISNPSARKEMIKKSRQTGIPVFEIKKSHGVWIVVGFDEAILRNALGLVNTKIKKQNIQMTLK